MRGGSTRRVIGHGDKKIAAGEGEPKKEGRQEESFFFGESGGSDKRNARTTVQGYLQGRGSQGRTNRKERPGRGEGNLKGKKFFPGSGSLGSNGMTINHDNTYRR